MGRVSPAAVGKPFTACAHLFAVKPWALADDTQAIRMDIPALDVDGVCVSVIGGLDGCLGVSIFPSVEGLERFSRRRPVSSRNVRCQAPSCCR